MPNIRPSSDLRNNYTEISDYCHQNNEPVFITKNGKGDLAVMRITEYEKLQAKASDLVSRKNVEYLVVEAAGETRELRLDKITSFSHPEIGTVVVSES